MLAGSKDPRSTLLDAHDRGLSGSNDVDRDERVPVDLDVQDWRVRVDVPGAPVVPPLNAAATDNAKLLG